MKSKSVDQLEKLVRSLPSRERGLKSYNIGKSIGRYVVAPLAGAWIEIAKSNLKFISFAVAPLAGAWIEIGYTEHSALPHRSRSPRGSVD